MKSPARFSSYSFNLSLPMVRESNGPICRTPEEVYRVLADTAMLAQETFTVLTLTTKYRVIDRHLISLGVIDAALISPGIAFRPAISDGATAIVLSHPHPSGDPTPSAEDIRITRQLVEAGKVLDIDVLDHVIIGRPQPGTPTSKPFVSLRESGLVSFAG